MNINRSTVNARQAYTLLELMVSVGIGTLILGCAVVSLAFMVRSLDATGNYAELDRQSRRALDIMTRDIRNTGGCIGYATNSLTFTNKDGTALLYNWNPATRYLVSSNFSQFSTAPLSNLLLKGCTSLRFTVFQRTPLTNSTMLFTPITNISANLPTIKVIVMDWICVKTNYTTLQNSESVQTAKIVLRN
jgi:hypothetical protein